MGHLFPINANKTVTQITGVILFKQIFGSHETNMFLKPEGSLLVNKVIKAGIYFCQCYKSDSVALWLSAGVLSEELLFFNTLNPGLNHYLSTGHRSV